MKKLLLLSFIFLSLESFSQTSRAISIELEVLNDSVASGSENSKLLIEYSVKNVSDSNLVLYRLADKAFDSPFGKTSAFCDPARTGAGVIFLLFDKNRQWKARMHMIISDYSNPMTRQRADSAMAIANADALRSTVILTSEETKILRQEIDLTGFKLEKGCYYIQLLYYAGTKIDHFVSDRQMKNDTESHHAEVYQGCSESNEARFVIN